MANDWRQKIVRDIQLLGQEISENAESYVECDDDALSDIDIEIEIRANTIPTIRIEKTFYSKNVLKARQGDWEE